MPGSDPKHWLHRFSADEWMRAAMSELEVARAAFGRHARRPALASARRAAGMGWNVVLVLEPDAADAFGRSYADHLRALAAGSPHPADDAAPIPEEVRSAARRLMDDPAAGPRQQVVQLVTPGRDERLLEDAQTIVAEAFARLLRSRARPPR